jgi:SAM-dependent methyltransferase
VSYLERNRDAWTGLASRYAERAAEAWASDEITWGISHVPEAELGLLGDVSGKDVAELGCGTAYFSAWLARRGALPVGVDLTPAQLETARRLQLEQGLDFPLVEANAEDVPLDDASFDLVVSEYGASIWCDPYRWVPEAARLLRPGGRLVFLRNSTLLMLCLPPAGPATEELQRELFGLHRLEWDDDDSVEFHLAHGEWIRLLRSNGFEVEALAELEPATDAEVHDDYVPTDWARRWPAEEVWAARKTA